MSQQEHETPPQDPSQEDIRQLNCTQCGGELSYHPGEASLACPYCGHVVTIPQSEDDIEELDFAACLGELEAEADMSEQHVRKCDACGAEVTFDEHVASEACPFCGSDVTVEGGTTRTIKPRSLLPFKVSESDARTAFRTWLKKLWFAPSKLKRLGRIETGVSGIYVPYWTYDCKTTTFYRGQRGEDYWTTQTYTTTENGKSVTKRRRVRKTRWHSVSGTVWNRFDDVLVLASTSLPKRLADKLEPWDLDELVPYQDAFLKGFRAESYQVGLAEGMEEAKSEMEGPIRTSIRRDIGGDHQRIHSTTTQYDDVTFKHILLPVWLSAYRFGEKVYRFMVNARTGEVQGERPWSWVKIALAVLGVAAAAAGAYFLFRG